MKPVLPPVTRTDGHSSLDGFGGDQSQPCGRTGANLYPVRVLSPIIEGIVGISCIAALGVFSIYVPDCIRPGGDREDVPRRGCILLRFTKFSALIVCNDSARLAYGLIKV